MKTNSTYMTRALQSRDRRFATVLGKLGYAAQEVAPEAVDEPLAVDDLAALRAEYLEVVGKRPFHGWDADALREKIAAAKAGE